MAVLPDGDWLIQSVDNMVVLAHRYTGEELLRFNASSRDEVAKAQGVIAQLDELTEEQRAMAHFWSGYFYAHLIQRVRDYYDNNCTADEMGGGRWEE